MTEKRTKSEGRKGKKRFESKAGNELLGVISLLAVYDAQNHAGGEAGYRGRPRGGF